MSSSRTSAKSFHIRSRKPREISGILDSVLKKYGLQEKIANYTFVLHWEEIVGKAIAKVATPHSVRNKTLVLSVRDSIWAQELTFRKEVIIKRLNNFLGDSEAIEDIY
ncbi:MAG: DUF721 domain-containing protein, partial [Candidatus Dadabacteria bacterium]